MAPETFAPEENELPPEQAVKLMEWLARSTSTRVISQLAIIILTFVSVPALATLGWAAVRMIGALDRLETQLQAENDKIIGIQGKIQLLDLTDMHLDAKQIELDGRMNKRVDQVSVWEQHNATEIDILKEKLYPLLPRNR